jgi:branched-chain amino acid transport system substrate-binding protein
MRHRRLLTPLVLLGAFGMIAAACSNSSSSAGGSTSGGAVDCDAAPGCVTVAAGAPIQIGTLLSVSGDNADLGNDSLYGIELAIDHLDGVFDGQAGQILNHPVQLQNEDETCSAEGGQAGSTKFASNPDIVAVLGTSCSGAALGVADKTLGDKGIVLLSPSNTNPALTAPGTHNPYYFRTAHNDAIQGAVVADFANQKLHAKTAATIHDESPYTEGLTTAFKNSFTAPAIGGQVVDEESIDSSQQSYTPVLTKIGQKSPDLLYGPDYTAECALILKQGRQVAGLANTAFMGSDGCYASNFIKLAGPVGLRSEGLLHERVPPGVQDACGHSPDLGLPRARLRRGEPVGRGDREGRGPEQRRLADDPARRAQGRGPVDDRFPGHRDEVHVLRHR